MKYCIYCGYKMPKQAMFCPHCGRKQITKPNNLQQNKAINKGTNTINLNVPLPIGLNDGPQPYFDPGKIAAYKHKMGFGTNTDYVVYASTGHAALRAGFTAGALNMTGASSLESGVGSVLASTSTTNYMLSFEPKGILFIGLTNNIRNIGKFSGKNSFLSDKDIDYITRNVSTITITTHGYNIKLKVPYLVFGQDQDRKGVFYLIKTKYNPNRNIKKYISNKNAKDKNDKIIGVTPNSKSESKSKIKLITIFIICFIVIIMLLLYLGNP